MRRSTLAGAGASALLALVVALTPGVVLPASGGQSPYPETVKLAMPYFSDIEADPARDRAFISGGGNIDAIEIVNAAGELAGSVPIRHAEDMQLSPDGETLYVAVNREPASVAAVDLDTLAVSTVAVIDGDTGSSLTPHRLVWTADMLWVLADPGGYPPTMVAVDPTSGVTHHFLLEESPQSIAASPGRPDTIVAAAWGDMYRYRVSGGESPTFEMVASRREATDDTDQIAMTSDGRHVVTVGEAGVPVAVMRVRDFARVDSYPAGRRLTALAIRPDGQVAVSYQGGVSVFAAGHTSFAALHKVPTWDSASGDVDTAFRGLAFGDDELFSVVEGYHPGNVRVAVLPDDAPVENPVPDGMQAAPYEDVTMFEQIVMVPGMRRGFLTPGSVGNGVFAINGAGRVTHVLEHLPGAAGMVLSRDNATLYVAIPGADMIAEIDTRTLRVRKIPTGPNTYPQSLALSGNRLWFTSSGGHSMNGVLNALDLRSGRIQTRVGEVAGTYLRTSPLHPNLLWVAIFDWVGGELATYRITRRGPAEAKLRQMIEVGPAQMDQTLTPDGLHLLPATPGTQFHPVLDAKTLELVGAPETQYSPVAVAVRDDGLFAAGVGDADLQFRTPTFQWAARLFQTPLGQQITKRGLYLPYTDWVAPRGLAFGRRNLYAVHQANDVQVVVKPMPPVRPVTLTADRSGYRRGDDAHLVARVTRGAVRETLVEVYRKTKKGRVLVQQGHPNRFGNLNIHVTFRGPARYVAIAQQEENRTWRSATTLRRGQS